MTAHEVDSPFPASSAKLTVILDDYPLEPAGRRRGASIEAPRALIADAFKGLR